MERWLDNPNFIFDASKYVQKGYEKEEGNFDQEERELFTKIRIALPELEQWGDLALGTALGDYFQQVYLASWLDLSDEQLTRDELIEFLTFVHYQQTIGDWPWGYDINKFNELISEAKK